MLLKADCFKNKTNLGKMAKMKTSKLLRMLISIYGGFVSCELVHYPFELA